ncbi:MAG: hypothetical protein K6A93_11135 [Bacteroidaceae bacterium]|nr:hypothetical protein [Bacteroidaceae bacterium]
MYLDRPALVGIVLGVVKATNYGKVAANTTITFTNKYGRICAIYLVLVDYDTAAMFSVRGTIIEPFGLVGTWRMEFSSDSSGNLIVEVKGAQLPGDLRILQII